MTTDVKERKATPIYSGVLKYFPDAIAEVARCSQIGNEQHNPGQPLHWDRSKSQDEHDACVRHLIEAGTIDTDGIRHSTKAAWRALAALQKEIEREKESLHNIKVNYSVVGPNKQINVDEGHHPKVDGWTANKLHWQD